MIDWIANVFSLAGAIMGSYPGNPRRSRDMNCLYFIGNVLGTIYFIMTSQWSFLMLYAFYIVIAIRGIYANQKTIKKSIEWNILYP